MVDRFEKLTTGVAQIYKNIQKIKKYQMNSFGLKGTHVMCIYYLDSCPEGMTASALCQMCKADKAGISRILADLERHGFIRYERPGSGKKYRSKAVLTEEGRTYAGKINDLILRTVLEAGKNITDAEREIFYRVLTIISGNLEHICLELENSDHTQKGHLHYE